MDFVIPVIVVLLVVAMMVFWIIYCSRVTSKKKGYGALITVSASGILIIAVCVCWNFGLLNSIVNTTEPAPTPQASTQSLVTATPEASNDPAESMESGEISEGEAYTSPEDTQTQPTSTNIDLESMGEAEDQEDGVLQDYSGEQAMQ